MKTDPQARNVVRVVGRNLVLRVVAANGDDEVALVLAGRPGGDGKSAGELNLGNEQIGTAGELASDIDAALFRDKARHPCQFDEGSRIEDTADPDQIDLE